MEDTPTTGDIVRDEENTFTIIDWGDAQCIDNTQDELFVYIRSDDFSTFRDGAVKGLIDEKGSGVDYVLFPFGEELEGTNKYDLAFAIALISNDYITICNNTDDESWYTGMVYISSYLESRQLLQVCLKYIDPSISPVLSFWFILSDYPRAWETGINISKDIRYGSKGNIVTKTLGYYGDVPVSEGLFKILFGTTIEDMVGSLTD